MCAVSDLVTQTVARREGGREGGGGRVCLYPGGPVAARHPATRLWLPSPVHSASILLELSCNMRSHGQGWTLRQRQPGGLAGPGLPPGGGPASRRLSGRQHDGQSPRQA